MIIQVNEDNITNRLDQILLAHYPQYSRNHIAKIIKSGACSINGKVEKKPSYNPKLNDQIEIFEDNLDLKNETIKPQDIKLDVIYEDKDILVIDKPINMLVHPGSGNYENTIANALAFLTKEMSTKDVNYGLVHRLDKDTSGVLITAKNITSLDYYSSKFENREVVKEYYCIVDCNISKLFETKDSIEVKGYIGRSHFDRKKMMFSLNEFSGSRYSETLFKLISKNDKYAFIKAYPKTGRTHQIRVHLKYLGYPILGDVIYKGEHYKRLMLHAKSVSLLGMSGKNLKFESKTPDTFIELFKNAE